MCLCNFCMSKGWYAIGEILIAGVPLALMLAGYLAGLEKIEKPIRWLAHKALYLIPYLLFVVISYSVYIISGVAKITAAQWLFCLFNAQGLNYTVWRFDGYEAVAGFSHLWILTTLAICILITPLLQKIKGVSLTPVKMAILIALLLLIQLGLLFLGVQLSYIITYVMGYVIATRRVRTDGKWYVTVCVITAAVTALRLAARALWDGTLFYNSFVALISSAVIGAWIFYTVFYLGDKLPQIYKALSTSLAEAAAGIFCYTYLTHYVFVKGPFCVGGYVSNAVLEFILITVFSVVSGAVLWLLSERLILKMLRKALEEN